jgi:hypothetical protein
VYLSYLLSLQVVTANGRSETDRLPGTEIPVVSVTWNEAREYLEETVASACLNCSMASRR